MLVVNAGSQQVTTAIVRGGVLLLHRTLEMNVVSEEVHPESYDRVDAEAAMQAELVSARWRERRAAVWEELVQTVDWVRDLLRGRWRRQ